MKATLTECMNLLSILPVIWIPCDLTFRMDEDESHSEKTKESERTESKEKGGRSESIKVDGPDLSAELQKLEEMVKKNTFLKQQD
jgi:hypothetical protein